MLAAPRVLYRQSAQLRQRVTFEWVKSMERIGLAGVLINIPGVLFFHVLYPEYQYDRFLHVTGAFTSLWWLALVLVPLIVTVSRRRFLIGLSVAAFFGIFAWEGFQWAQDQVTGSHTFFDYAQPIAVDFREDVVFGVFGAAAGLWTLGSRFTRYNALRRKE